MDEEDLLDRHRQEKKELKSKVVELKKGIPKNDKKKKKEIMDEITRLETELRVKQERELDGFLKTCFGSKSDADDSKSSEGVDDIPAIEKLSIDDDEDGEESGGDQFNNLYQVRKISKAQRKRDKKAQLEKEKQERIEAESKELYQNSAKKLEEDRFKAILDGLGLSLYDIPSDGDCMFKAIEHQLSLRGRKTNVQELRSVCASELRKRTADFLPFLINTDSDDIMDEERYHRYCDKIEKTKCWGGNIELQALSYALEVPIKVIQATGPSVDIGIERYSSQQPLIISYHRHAYQLGEHYNSIIPDGSNPH
ncbi:OTU domain-containing protein 6B [Tetranychus urticae]|uniref:OTU domain-containing protein n=1 Tax=Tetranychus urticae TaxID=32264 RepID=T1K273_TETUR|nr:OTU domain-containing protein 6B [Tetranychus urticae]